MSVIREELQVERMFVVGVRQGCALSSFQQFISYDIHKVLVFLEQGQQRGVTGDSLENLTSFDTEKLQKTAQCFRVNLRDYY